MEKKIIAGIKVLLLLLLLSTGCRLLGDDSRAFLTWWLAVLLMGIGCLPLTGSLFSSFRDGGWIVSKVLGIAFSGFVTWFLVCCNILPFTGTICLGVSIGLLLCIWAGFFFLYTRKNKGTEPRIRFWGEWSSILGGELVFTIFFIIWTYLAGFHPAAYGTEKFMDYGFMMAMMRSQTLPAKDLWYAGGTLNYYYGGQYFAVFLTKLTGTQVEQTYHLMRTLVAGLAYALPFTLVRQMLLDYQNRPEKFPGENKKTDKYREGAALLGGILAGAGVSLAGNMHYVIIGKLLPWIRNVFNLPQGDYTYWFPNSTRYIGYYPEGNDKTIHEFPSYSFVLGDLHAHVVNVMFVLTVICLTYAMVQKYKGKHCHTGSGGGRAEVRSGKQLVYEALTEPFIWVFAFFIGLFHWTNYWDFVIYYVMGGLGVIYCNYLKFADGGSRKKRLQLTGAVSLLHAVWVFVWGSIFALPFTLRFETMVNGVALAQNHSRPYQWWMIWGLPLLMTILYVICVFRDREKEQVLLEYPDFFGVILGVSAVGLILIPELVYVRDIYEKEYARSNTMFKLTYQAFIMFGILMGYGFVRLWMNREKVLRKVLTSVGFLCFIGCCCYIGTAVHAWFGQVWNPRQYQGLDATAFLETSFSQDAAAIRWINDNVEGSSVVLEANGDSYSDYERVSAMTGLPTILGWYVHEWLWRGGTEELNQRVGLVETVYTSTDQVLVESILKEYEVEYIFVGRMEREKYAGLNEELLNRLGEVVFMDENTGTYIIRYMDTAGHAS